MGWSAGAQNHAMDDSPFLGRFAVEDRHLGNSTEHQTFVTEALRGQTETVFGERFLFSVDFFIFFFGGHKVEKTMLTLA